MKSKQVYQRLVAKYKWRRQACKKKHKLQVARMTQKIKIWNRQIRRIEQRERNIAELGQKVKEFSGMVIKNSYPSYRKELVLARYLFYKHGLENGLRSIDLAQYTGCKLSCTPAKARRQFNKRMLSHELFRTTWERFKIFMSNDQNRTISTRERNPQVREGLR